MFLTLQTGQLYFGVSRPEMSNVICSDLYNDLDMPTVEDPETQARLAADYSNFSKWIPRYIEPDEPCAYCRDRRLNCYLSYGKVTCTACVCA